MRIRMHHMRQMGYCSRGVRLFFKNHEIDWAEFLKNGVDASVLLDTKDAMAIRLVEAARGE